MSDFQLRKMEDRPLDEQTDNEPVVSRPTDLRLESLPDDLYGAKLAEGPNEVAKALEQVAKGKATHQELLEWIDDIRETFPELQKQPDLDVEKEKPNGFLHDFQPDSQIAAGESEGPPPFTNEDLPRSETKANAFGIDDDLDYMFPATRRRRQGDDDDEDGDGDGGDPAPKKAEEKTKKH